MLEKTSSEEESMKYITFNSGEFVVLPKSQSHKDVVLSGRVPVSAGFLELHFTPKMDGSLRLSVKVWGYSESLGLDADERDALVIHTFIQEGVHSSWKS